ncbi:MAG: prolipoprotein diacylglyceryl transferase [bacterium]
MTYFAPLLSIPFPEIDPVFFHIGPFPIRWYALAYISGIAIGWWYLTTLLKATPLWQSDIKGTAPQGPPLNREQLDDLLFWVTLGVILGGRIGYVLFYEPNLLVAPWVSVKSMIGGEGLLQTLFGWIHIPPAIMIWKGGMSFHGGLIGVSLAGLLYSRKYGLDALRIGDLFACAAPFGLFFGRIANFIRGELYGRASDVPWAMKFPEYYDDRTSTFIYAPDAIPRHPSQLYEATLEGIVLFLVLFIGVRKFKLLTKPGAAMGLFIAGYGVSRIIVEFFREPDSHMPDFLKQYITMGMILSLPMVLLGSYFVWRAYGGGIPKAPPRNQAR